jgi:hypothetical protein
MKENLIGRGQTQSLQDAREATGIGGATIYIVRIRQIVEWKMVE